MLRKRNDSVKPGKGIDGTEGENYSRDYAVDPWSNYGNRQVPGDRDIKGRKVRENVSGGEAAYSPDDDAPLRNVEDFQFTARGGSAQRGAPKWGDDIWQQVEGVGDYDGPFTGPVKEIKRK